MKSFNSSPVVPTPSLGDYSNNVVTSKWVKDLSVAPVYVNGTSGDDSNDGLTEQTAVKTIGRGISISGKIHNTGGSDAYIKLSAGSYTENVDISWMRVHIDLLGNATVTGNIVVRNQSNLIILGSYSFTNVGELNIQRSAFLRTELASWTQNGNMNINGSAAAYFANSVSITATGTTTPLAVQLGAFCYMGQATIVSGNATQVVLVDKKSALVLPDGATLNSGGVTYGCLVCTRDSYFECGAAFTITGSTTGRSLLFDSGGMGIFTSAINTSNMTSNAGIQVTRGSVWYAASNANNFKITTGIAILLSHCSTAYLTNGATITTSSTDSIVRVDTESDIWIGGTLSLTCTNSSGANVFIDVTLNSCACINSVYFAGSTKPDSSGHNALVSSLYSSVIRFNSSGTQSGASGLVGKRFLVNVGGIIDTGGRGVNFLPGSEAGVISGSITVKDTGGTNRTLSLNYGCYY